jgi:hypothetical protein
MKSFFKKLRERAFAPVDIASLVFPDRNEI